MDRALDDRIHATIRMGQSVSARSLAHALDLVRDSVVIVDNRGHITYLNHAAEQLSGWTSAEVEGRVARTTLFSASKSSFEAAWREVWDKGEWRGTIAQCGRSGVERLVESHWSTLFEEQSSSVLMISGETSNMNLTAAGLAHEIRNPLAGIKGVADAFLQRGQLTRQEREWMEAVRHEVMKIDARIRELLDLSQPRTFNALPCLLSDLIDRVVLLATQSIRDRQITVEFIDDTTESLVISLDQTRIEDAVLNLVVNAIESIDGTGRVSICLRREDSVAGSEVVIEVTDT
ncbi:MAG TPA: histidine kinase dimerization/phospho-acceptor domain-containing protein, partial [Pyrinomonadaceae bacterium]|nr:histidine kinase dimerization/phospho-acceptor domain-containing protein [Pyrinomonadaceae bacterium]